MIAAAWATWPIFLTIGLVVAACYWADDKDRIRRLEEENDRLRDQAEHGYTRADELTRRRHDRIRRGLADGTLVVPSQPKVGDR